MIDLNLWISKKKRKIIFLLRRRRERGKCEDHLFRGDLFIVGCTIFIYEIDFLVKEGIISMFFPFFFVMFRAYIFLSWRLIKKFTKNRER